jgi:hypothetical protein
MYSSKASVCARQLQHAAAGARAETAAAAAAAAAAAETYGQRGIMRTLVYKQSG